MNQVARSVAAQPVLHWKGGWTTQRGKVTADVRAMGTGDVFGTIRLDDYPAQVIHLDGGPTLVKGGSAYWKQNGFGKLPDKEAHWYANRWVEDDSDLLAHLGDLAPGTLGPRLRATATGSGSGAASPSSTVWTAAPAESSAAAEPPPSGVSSNAPRFEVSARPTLNFGDGKYWASTASPHHLLGYSGQGLPEGDATDALNVTLTVRPGTDSESKTAYSTMAAQVRGLPASIRIYPGDLGKIINESADVASYCNSPTYCRDALPVEVTVRNITDRMTLEENVDIEVTGTYQFTDTDISHSAGTCSVSLPRAAPGKTVHGSCAVTGSALARIWAEAPSNLKWVNWSASPSSELYLTAPSNAASLAAKLASRADKTNSTSPAAS